MPAYQRPRESKARTVGVLAVAFTIPVLVLAWSQLGGDDRPTPRARPAAEVSTAPTVLAEEIVASTSLPDSPPASPATVLLPDPAVVTSGTSSTTPPPTLIPPVTVTSPPLRTTTTRPATTTTDGSTTTEQPPVDR